MPPGATAAVVLALSLDLVIQEFPARVHPVAWYGTNLERLDRGWANPRLVSALAAVGLPLGAGAIAGLTTALAGHAHPVLAVVLAGGVLFSTTSLRMLVDTAGEVIAASGSSPADARERLPSLVGRDPAALSPGEVRSAAVESAAENLADGLVAPLLAFVLFSWSLPLAAGATAWVKAVNTGDSMLGYREKPVGWAFARLDDLVMWLPARLTAVLLAAAARDPGAVVRARSWARTPTSPNSGWPMATMAAVLDARLEKPGAYTLNPAGPLPSEGRAHRGIRVVGLAGATAVVGAAVIAWP